MIAIVVAGRRPRKNERGTIGRTRFGGACRITPAKTRRWRDGVYMVFDGEPITSGAVVVTIRVFEDRLLHLDVVLPQGDIDSTLSAVLDALQPKDRKKRLPPFVLDDDARIIDLHVYKRYDKKNPRIEIIIEGANSDQDMPQLPEDGRRRKQRPSVRDRRALR